MTFALKRGSSERITVLLTIFLIANAPRPCFVGDGLTVKNSVVKSGNGDGGGDGEGGEEDAEDDDREIDSMKRAWGEIGGVGSSVILSLLLATLFSVGLRSLISSTLLGFENISITLKSAVGSLTFQLQLHPANQTEKSSANTGFSILVSRRDVMKPANMFSFWSNSLMTF